MSHTPIGSLGQTAQHGFVVVASRSTLANDLTHVALDPDNGRFIMRNPNTQAEYSTVASCTAGSIALIKEHL